MKALVAISLLFISFYISAESEVLADYIPDDMPVIPAEAYVTAPQGIEEGAVGTTDRYGEKLDAFIMKTFPDIRRYKYKPDSIISGDKDLLEMSKASFYRALYFSKLVKLSNGKVLFDFITKCAKLNDSVTLADRQRADSNEFYIQYYFELKRKDSGEVVGESIYLNRVGNRFSATRTPFAYFALSDKNFMKTFGLKCFK
ncbi:Uncharacterised protein [Serratia plymuthica]|nr:Uncharacterised protein [Serratia plymuthica]